MRRSPFPLSQSPLRRCPNDREPAFGAVTTLTLSDARASNSYVLVCLGTPAGHENVTNVRTLSTVDNSDVSWVQMC